MCKHMSLATLLAVFFTCILVPAQAQNFYISTELGMNIGRSLDMVGTHNDRGSVCDGYINPQYAEVESYPGYENYNCTGADRGSTDSWNNSFGSGKGIFFGTALGYHIPNSPLRVELEYFYRDTGYDETSGVDSGPSGGGQSGDKLKMELLDPRDIIDSMTSHNLFANLYRDFSNDSKFTPYVGLGIGLGLTEVDYESVWPRNSDVNHISTGAGLPNVDEIRANLAGTTSVGSEQFSDTLFGYQVMVGVDYELSETLLLGLKARWVDFESLSGGVVWNPMRGHPPYLRTPEQAAAAGTDQEFVKGKVKIDGIEMFAVSLNLKYLF